MSYQKKDWRGHAHPYLFWYDNDKDLKVGFLVTHVFCGEGRNVLKWFSLNVIRLSQNTIFRFKNATWRWQWALPVTAVIPCLLYLLENKPLSKNKYFPRYELFSTIFCQVRTTDRQTESGAYEPTVQMAQVGSKIKSVIDCKDSLTTIPPDYWQTHKDLGLNSMYHWAFAAQTQMDIWTDAILNVLSHYFAVDNDT